MAWTVTLAEEKKKPTAGAHAGTTYTSEGTHNRRTFKVTQRLKETKKLRLFTPEERSESDKSTWWIKKIYIKELHEWRQRRGGRCRVQGAVASVATSVQCIR